MEKFSRNINLVTTSEFLQAYKKKFNMTNDELGRMVNLPKSTMRAFVAAFGSGNIHMSTYKKLLTLVPKEVMNKYILSEEEIREAERVGFTQTYIATSEGTEKKKINWKDVQDALFDARDTIFYNKTKKINHPEDTDQIRQKDVDSIAYSVAVLEEYARKAQTHRVELTKEVELLSEELKKIHYTLNNRTLWQRIKNKFRKNHSTEKTYINVDENSRKK